MTTALRVRGTILRAIEAWRTAMRVERIVLLAGLGFMLGITWLIWRFWSW